MQTQEAVASWPPKIIVRGSGEYASFGPDARARLAHKHKARTAVDEFTSRAIRAEAIVLPACRTSTAHATNTPTHFGCEAYQAGLNVRFWHLADIFARRSEIARQRPRSSSRSAEDHQGTNNAAGPIGGGWSVGALGFQHLADTTIALVAIFRNQSDDDLGQGRLIITEFALTLGGRGPQRPAS